MKVINEFLLMDPTFHRMLAKVFLFHLSFCSIIDGLLIHKELKTFSNCNLKHLQLFTSIYLIYPMNAFYSPILKRDCNLRYLDYKIIVHISQEGLRFALLETLNLFGGNVFIYWFMHANKIPCESIKLR